VLGFSFDFKYGDPTVYAGVKSNQAEIYFCDSSVQAHIVKENNLTPEIFIWVADAQRLLKNTLTMVQMYLSLLPTGPGVRGNMLSEKSMDTILSVRSRFKWQ
jgi:hypothetical protein